MSLSGNIYSSFYSKINYNVKIFHFTFLAKPIDNCITTSSSQTVISKMYVINGIVCSDQSPLCLNIDCDMPLIYNESVANMQRNVHKWQLVNIVNLQEYKLDTHKLADDIIIPYDALCCRNSNCTLHNNDIDGFIMLYCQYCINLHKAVFLPLC